MSNVAELFPEAQPAVATFDKFWQWVPRKVAKLDARREWDRLVKEYDPEDILAGARMWNAEWRGKDRSELKYCCHPRKWLRDGRWMDYEGTDIPEPEKPTIEARSVLQGPIAQQWQNVCDKLLGTVPRDYLAKLTVIALDDNNRPILKASNAFVRNQVIGSYVQHIERVWGRKVVVR